MTELDRFEASPSCTLCSGDVATPQWTQSFDAVFVQNGEVTTGKAYYGQPHILDAESGKEMASITFTRSFLIESTIFLVHSSCHRLLRDFLRCDIDPTLLFKLCRVLHAIIYRCRVRKLFSLTDCLDPTVPVISLSSQYEIAPLPDCKSRISRLPPEVVLMIFEMLPPSSLIEFLCSSLGALQYANEFGNKLTQFHRCLDVESYQQNKWSTMIRKIFSTFTPTEYASLDKRWKVVSKVSRRAKIVNLLPVDCLVAPSVDPHNFFRSVNHSFGFQELLADVPETLKTIRVYQVALDGRLYVCGLELRTDTSHHLLGRVSSLQRTVDVSQREMEIIQFIIDPLGVRSLRFANSSWSGGDPETLAGWEGLSKRQWGTDTIRVIQDGVKFRQIGWRQHGQTSFQEQLLVRSKHVFDRGIAPKEEFLGGYAYHNRFLVSRFGSFPVDAIWLSEDTRGIIVYGNDPRQDRDAIIASDEPSKPHKHRSMARLFPLHPPGEWITEVVAQEYRRSVTLKTNWNREFQMGFIQGGDVFITFRPPTGHSIAGFCVQSRGSVFGMIYAPKSRTLCPSLIPKINKVPEIPPELGLRSFHVFASFARFSRVHKIHVYYDSAWCIGMRIFYSSGVFECVGRGYGDNFQTFVIDPDISTYHAWVQSVEKYRRIRRIDFSIGSSEPPCEKAERFKITNLVIIAWWFRKDCDIVRFTNMLE